MENRKLLLKSDFRDFYDPFFDNPNFPGDNPVVYERFAKGGMLRPAAFRYMDKTLGLEVPHYGTNQAILDEYGQGVIYYIPHAHRGEGKALMDSYRYVPEDYLVDFAARYVLPDEGPAVSYRLLHIGRAWATPTNGVVTSGQKST